MAGKLEVIEALFNRALEFRPEERASFLAGACGHDLPLLARLEGLLQAHAAAEALMPDDLPGAPPAAEQVTEQTGDRIGNYKLLQQIGEGGCGIVYLAEQERPVRRKVALKVIKLGMDTRQVVARFEAERQAIALMDHPHIARVLDAGATNSGRPFFVMELVQGVKLTSYCDQQRLTTRERLELFILVCRAVQHAHQKGIIHRDLKPSNILVCVQDRIAVPKVIDFGIAKAIEGRLTDVTLFTAVDRFVGTPAYMSPEQAALKNGDIDTRSDIYSLGVLLYELLTGRTPFDTRTLLASGLDEMRRTITGTEPARPSTRLHGLTQDELTQTARRHSEEECRLIRQVRGDLDWIVMKCLEKDRSRRYETANGLAADVRRHLANEPVVARPQRGLYKLRKFGRRHRLVLVAGAVVLSALVLALAISLIAAQRAAKSGQAAVAAKQESERQRHRAEQGERNARHHLYIANLNLVQAAWEHDNAARAKALLAETAADPDRGFEWYYWQRELHRELRQLRGHSSAVQACFSPDGQRVLTASWDGTAAIWDAETGRRLLVLKGHADGINQAVFVPDGGRIITASADQTARIWDAQTGQPIALLRGHVGPIRCIAISRDGRRIATGSVDRSIRLWDAKTGDCARCLVNPDQEVRSIAFSPNGRRLASVGSGTEIVVWDIATGQPSLKIHRPDDYTSVAFSPDGESFLVGSPSERAILFDAGNGNSRLSLETPNATVMSVGFSPDGRWNVTGGGDGVVRVWQGTREIRSNHGHRGPVGSVAFSPDGRRIVSGGVDHTVRIWAAPGERTAELFAETPKSLKCIAFSLDGRFVICGDTEDSVTVWEAGTGKPVSTLLGHTGPIASVALSADGELSATAGTDETIRLWDTRTGRQRRVLEGHRARVWAVAFFPDGRRLLSGGDDSAARIWDVAKGNAIQVLRGHAGPVNSVAVSRDGRTFLTGSDDRTAKLWDASTGRELLTLAGHEDAVAAVAIAPDGRSLLTGSYDKTARIWEAGSGKLLQVLAGHNDRVIAADFSPDGRRVATASRDWSSKLWDPTAGKELLTLRNQYYAHVIHAIGFSPDGRRLFVVGEAREVDCYVAADPSEVVTWSREDRAENWLPDEPKINRPASEPGTATPIDPEPNGAIRNWLVLAPLPAGGTQAELIEAEQIPEEGHLRPRFGDVYKIGTRELHWQKAQTIGERLDFNRFCGQSTPWSVAYAVCYLVSQVARTNLVLGMGSDDEAKLYLNGQLLNKTLNPREWEPAASIIAGVDLKAGTNALVLKVMNETGAWDGSVRLTDADRKPVPGVEFLIDGGASATIPSRSR